MLSYMYSILIVCSGVNVDVLLNCSAYSRGIHRGIKWFDDITLSTMVTMQICQFKLVERTAILEQGVM
jgi:hypothetical protein